MTDPSERQATSTTQPAVPGETPDRRRHDRFDLLALVHVRQGSVAHVLEIVNLSRGGARIDLGKELRPRWLVVGREIEVRVLDEHGGELLGGTAHVVRIDETLERQTYAIEFVTPHDESVVRKALAAAGKPPPLPVKRR
jgi:PilZ domain-containing protein